MWNYQSMIMFEMRWSWEQTPLPAVHPSCRSTSTPACSCYCCSGVIYGAACAAFPATPAKQSEDLHVQACLTPGESLAEEPGYVGMWREYLREKGERVERGRLSEQRQKAERRDVRLGRGRGNRERKAQLLSYEVEINLVNRHILQPSLNQLTHQLSWKNSSGLLYPYSLKDNISATWMRCTVGLRTCSVDYAWHTWL